ncbi:MAG: tetratricopeptide repeat protein [Planctomycetes bacterium]|nr:tetratricopeptide repeat protein [Planctomycetota bacterium]
MVRREKLEALLQSSPDDPFLHFGLAMELAKEGDVASALARFDRVIELDHGYAPAFYHKGSVLIASGRFDEARAVLRAGVQAARAAGNAHAESEMQALLDTAGE